MVECMEGGGGLEGFGGWGCRGEMEFGVVEWRGEEGIECLW